MPNYKGHLIGGSIAFLATNKIIALSSNNFATNFNQNWLIYLFFCLIGSLFPDIDTKSKIQRYFYIFIFLILINLIIDKNWQLIVILTPISLLPMIVHHRGIFHKFWFLSLLSLIFLAFTWTYFPNNVKNLTFSCIFFISGWLSHLLLDYGILRFFNRKIINRFKI
ncbi:MAG: metal-dependent hydrolase [bacterium]